MTKKLIILFLLCTLILSACSDKTDTWRSVQNTEWSNFSVWAGSGFFFYEDNNSKYCTFMIYGSGVEVADYYTTTVEVDGNKLIVKIPSSFTSSYLNEQSNGEEVTSIELIYDEGLILVNGYEFDVHEGTIRHKSIYLFDQEAS